jgi:hypothetical protein
MPSFDPSQYGEADRRLGPLLDALRLVERMPRTLSKWHVPLHFESHTCSSWLCLALIPANTAKRTAVQSIPRSRSMWPPGPRPVSSIGGSKNVSSGLVGYAGRTVSSAGSKMLTFAQRAAHSPERLRPSACSGNNGEPRVFFRPGALLLPRLLSTPDKRRLRTTLGASSKSSLDLA